MWTRTVALIGQQIRILLLSQEQKISVWTRVSSEPLVRAANTLKFRTTSIFIGSVACPRGLLIYAQCSKTLVSSTDYAFNFHFFSLVGQSYPIRKN